MKRVLLILAVAGIFSVVGYRVHAQTLTSTTPSQLIAVGVHTSCQISLAGQTNACFAGDGLWISTNGAAYFQVTQSSLVAAVLTVNGKKPDSAGNVTLSATTTATSLAPTVTAATTLQ